MIPKVSIAISVSKSHWCLLISAASFGLLKSFLFFSAPQALFSDASIMFTSEVVSGPNDLLASSRATNFIAQKI